MDDDPIADALAVIGLAVRSVGKVSGGYTQARRVIATLADGSTCFVKLATDELAAGWLRDEHAIYEALQGQPFMARVLGWRDGPSPVLVLEDLSHLRHIPPWQDGDMARALDTLDQLAQEPAPAHLGALAARRPALMSRWDALLADPQMPARAGVVVSPEQLRQLHAQASALNLDGPHVVHLDVRSDNLLLDDEAGRAVLLDWNWSVRGNRDLDLALLAVRTEAEGGPHPDDIAPAARPFASLLCGMWMQALADSTASDERQALQRGCLRAALRWALA